MMPSITVCSFLTVTNGFKLFDQNLALTNGAPSNTSEMLALNIYRTFYGRAGFEGVGQAKAVMFFILVALIAIIQNKLTTSKEVQASTSASSTAHSGPDCSRSFLWRGCSRLL